MNHLSISFFDQDMLLCKSRHVRGPPAILEPPQRICTEYNGAHIATLGDQLRDKIVGICRSSEDSIS